jgi:hypothetical protein
MKKLLLLLGVGVIGAALYFSFDWAMDWLKRANNSTKTIRRAR